MAKTLTLRIDDSAVLSNLDYATQNSGARTASKAIFFALDQYRVLSPALIQRNDEIARLKEEVRRLRRIIEASRMSAASLLDVVSQDDLLS